MNEPVLKIRLKKNRAGMVFLVVVPSFPCCEPARVTESELDQGVAGGCLAEDVEDATGRTTP